MPPTPAQTRFSTLLPLDDLPSVAIIGCGAIGRQVALTLGHMGLFSSLALYDPDVVSIENVGTQGWSPRDVGRFKVNVLEDELEIENSLDLVTLGFRWSLPPRSSEPEAVFLCVDNIATREEIFREHPRSWKFWCDARMAAEVARILTVAGPRDPDSLPSPRSCTDYARTFFSASDAYEGPCTARSTFYCAALAANLMVSQYAKWLRGRPTDPDLTLSLPESNLFPTPVPDQENHDGPNHQEEVLQEARS